MFRKAPFRKAQFRKAPFATAALLVGSLLLGGCSSASTGVAPTTSGTATGEQVIKLGWAKGKAVTPSDRIAVKLGSKVRLDVTSDVAEIIHLHVNDAEQDIAAGGTVTFNFTADKAGIFDVEVHKADKLIAQLQVS